MQTRRDQLAAYRYSVKRVLLALMGSDPEQIEQPMRRVATATMAGALVAVLVCVGAGFYGKWKGGSASSWQKTDVLLVERETGSRYVWTGEELRPVLNYTSARLLLQQADVQTKKVSRDSIAGAKRGAPVGIAGAPDSLPDADHVVNAPWTVCTTHSAESGDISTLIVGSRTPGHDIGDNAVLVRSGDAVSLVWHGKRLAADAENLRSLGLDSEQALAVPAAWINALPPGPDLVPLQVDGAGGAGTVVAGRATRIGDVVKADSPGGTQWYVSLRDGFAPITETQALLLTGTVGAQLVEATTAQVNRAQISSQRPGSADLPDTKPTLAEVDGDAALCIDAVAADGSIPDTPRVSVGGDTGTLSPTQPQGTTGQTVDRLAVEPGTVAVVSALMADGKTAPGLFLVTDTGQRFAVPTIEAAEWLGYGSVTPLPVPSRLLALIPQGPALDAAAARGVTGTPAP